MQEIKIAWKVFKAIRGRTLTGSTLGYQALTHNGVPTVTVLFATGREASRISDLALQASEKRAAIFSEEMKRQANLHR